MNEVDTVIKNACLHYGLMEMVKCLPDRKHLILLAVVLMPFLRLPCLSTMILYKSIMYLGTKCRLPSSREDSSLLDPLFFTGAVCPFWITDATANNANTVIIHRFILLLLSMFYPQIRTKLIYWSSTMSLYVQLHFCVTRNDNNAIQSKYEIPAP